MPSMDITVESGFNSDNAVADSTCVPTAEPCALLTTSPTTMPRTPPFLSQRHPHSDGLDHGGSDATLPTCSHCWSVQNPREGANAPLSSLKVLLQRLSSRISRSSRLRGHGPSNVKDVSTRQSTAATWKACLADDNSPRATFNSARAALFAFAVQLQLLRHNEEMRHAPHDRGALVDQLQLPLCLMT